MRKYLIAGTIAFLAGAIVGCSNSPTAPERVKFVSSISAVKCSNNFYSLKATWNVPAGTKWKAIFLAVADTAKETSSFDATATKTTGCKFSLNKQAYAILDNAAIVSDNDMTSIIVVK